MEITMLTRSTKRTLLSLAVAAGVFGSSPLALASTSFDGTWVIDVPASTTIAATADSACPALRFPVQIRDNQVTGVLTRVPSRDGAVIVEAGNGGDAAPVSGTVQPDGTVTAQWENYHATGTLNGDTGIVTVAGECGPRTAHAVRVAP
jgi:hypothetical protein